ncbi:hypothetical protein [Janthinobacterium sp.]|uniref:hypothetical protein n=1 Tax=Janthinobacterium sp. TaxID=1871054 RepID=UPI0025B93475|nr:hypothetical protein [Janthinobacterium sp.]
MNKNKNQPSLKDLYKFRDRLRREILGEEDKEYRAELEFVLSRTNEKIREVSAKQGKI